MSKSRTGIHLTSYIDSSMVEAALVPRAARALRGCQHSRELHGVDALCIWLRLQARGIAHRPRGNSHSSDGETVSGGLQALERLLLPLGADEQRGWDAGHAHQ